MKGFFTFFFCVLAFNAFAQVSLSGKVTDKNKLPLAGATILLDEISTGAAANTGGEFSIRGIPKGNYTLQISFIGYQTIRMSLTLEEDQYLEINLEESTTMLPSPTIYALKDYPITHTEITKKELSRQNLGQDLPILLNFAPSIVTTSDAGAGIGYTGLRVRGSDAQRTNVTLNGIPVNDAESHGVFWVNMPDLASTVDNVVIQRGVGTSVNGAGAFGASVNITTQQPGDQAFAQVTNAYGSFNTWRHTAEVGTGTLGEHFSFYGRLSKITSDGFIDNAFSDLRSFYLSGAYKGKAGNLTLNIFSGKEQTFQAWYGVPEAILAQGNRTFNPVANYDNETDNYQQDHYQLLYDKRFSPQWKFNAALHYTRGLGYYEQFQGEGNPFAERSFSLYGLAPVILGQDTITETDLIRRRWLDNHFLGGIWSLEYRSRNENLSLIFGGGANHYQGGRYGEVIWAQFASNGPIRHRYYDNSSEKTDFNAYLKANLELKPGIFVFADGQVRTVDFRAGGFESLALNNAAVADQFLFFNPKVGMTFSGQNREAYFTLGIGNKEPVLLDYYAPNVLNGNTDINHETLRNLEVGYSQNIGQVAFAINYYLMDYRNQLVATGQLNDVGFNVRTNVPDSYRTGIELQLKTQLGEKVNWEANATFSRNKIRNYTEFLTDFASFEERAITYQQTDIALSPSVIAGSQWVYSPTENLQIALLSKYVGEQYLDNTSSPDRKLDPYFTNDLRVNYNFSLGIFKELALSLLINNIFNETYESNGYTFSYFLEGERLWDNSFYPQAGTNFIGALRMKF